MPQSPERSDTDVLGVRIGAQIVDLIAVAVIFVGGFFVLYIPLALLGATEGVAGLLVGPGALLAAVSYSVVLETVWNGQTVGKRLFGIRVVTEGGERIGVGKALVRNIPVLFSYGLLANAVALLSIAATDRRQRLFDQAAGTVVVDADFDGTAEASAGEDTGWTETGDDSVGSNAATDGTTEESGDSEWTGGWEN